MPGKSERQGRASASEKAFARLSEWQNRKRMQGRVTPGEGEYQGRLTPEERECQGSNLGGKRVPGETNPGGERVSGNVCCQGKAGSRGKRGARRVRCQGGACFRISRQRGKSERQEM